MALRVFYYKCAIQKNSSIIINVCNVEGFKKDSGAVKCPRGTFIYLQNKGKGNELGYSLEFR